MNENDTMSWVVIAHTFNPRAGSGTAKDTQRESVSKKPKERGKGCHNVHLVSAGAYRGQKVLEPLEMELQAAGSSHGVVE